MNRLEAVFDTAATDRARGATEIERRLVGGLLRERSRWTDDGLARGADRLIEGQPAMANLRNLARVVRGPDLARVTEILQRREEALAEHPLAGGLFCAQVGVAGLPASGFVG